MDESKLREFIKSILRELEDEDIEEVTTTSNVDGNATPRAFSKKKKKCMAHGRGPWALPMGEARGPGPCARPMARPRARPMGNAQSFCVLNYFPLI